LKDPQFTIDYHKGELLTPSEIAGATDLERAQSDALRKPPVVLEADEAVIIKALKQRMAAVESR